MRNPLLTLQQLRYGSRPDQRKVDEPLAYRAEDKSQSQGDSTVLLYLAIYRMDPIDAVKTVMV